MGCQDLNNKDWSLQVMCGLHVDCSLSGKLKYGIFTDSMHRLWTDLDQACPFKFPATSDSQVVISVAEYNQWNGH